MKQAGAAVRAGDEVPLVDQLRCAEREVRYRRKVYRALVHQKRMRAEDAEREIWHMQAIVDTLRKLAGEPTHIQPELEI